MARFSALLIVSGILVTALAAPHHIQSPPRDELAAREPFGRFGQIGNLVQRIAHSAHSLHAHNYRRELNDLDARNVEDLETEMVARDFTEDNDIEARELGDEKEARDLDEEDALEARGVEDVTEVLIRDNEAEDLLERELVSNAEIDNLD